MERPRRPANSGEEAGAGASGLRRPCRPWVTPTQPRTAPCAPRASTQALHTHLQTRTLTLSHTPLHIHVLTMLTLTHSLIPPLTPALPHSHKDTHLPSHTHTPTRSHSCSLSCTRLPPGRGLGDNHEVGAVTGAATAAGQGLGGQEGPGFRGRLAQAQGAAGVARPAGAKGVQGGRGKEGDSPGPGYDRVWPSAPAPAEVGSAS